MIGKQTIQGICKTGFGAFRINVGENGIHVIGRDLCASIELRSSEPYLSWLKTRQGGCDFTVNEIEASNTVRMADMAFSLLRKNLPEKSGFVFFLDDTGLALPNSNNRRINFMKAYLLLHRKTWYEDKLGAVMCDPGIYARYRGMADANYDDPAKKPAVFDFGSANEKLGPLYENSKTWGDFIEKFAEAFGNEKYALMEEWYRRALYLIFDGLEINQNWCIDVSKRPYGEFNILRLGGRTTRKSKKVDVFANLDDFNSLEPYSFQPREM